jgi:hypothetical protein
VDAGLRRHDGILESEPIATGSGAMRRKGASTAKPKLRLGPRHRQDSFNSVQLRFCEARLRQINQEISPELGNLKLTICLTKQFAVHHEIQPLVETVIIVKQRIKPGVGFEKVMH